jgi:hypothetical protein
MGRCKDCKFSAPEGNVFRCLNPGYHWTFRAGADYGCDRYSPAPIPDPGAPPAASAAAVASEIRDTLGTHYQVGNETRLKARVLAAAWRHAVAYESRPEGGASRSSR